MRSMFSGAVAFNQPLNFETAKVVDVRVCVESNLKRRQNLIPYIPFQLFVR